MGRIEVERCGSKRGQLRVLAGIAALLVSLTLLPGVSARTQIVVVTTTPDLKSITEAIAGGTATVESLIPKGADPEAFEPRPNHLATLRRADLVLRVGAGYEHWLDRFLQRSGRDALMPGGAGYLDLSSQIALLEVRGRSVNLVPGHVHGSANPHYWLDPVNVEIIAGQIAAALIRLRPEEKAVIETAHGEFVAALRGHVARWSKILEPYRGLPLVSYHNTWPYFARRFRLNLIAVIEEKEGIPPSLARLKKLADTMRVNRVRLILHEPFQPGDTSRLLGKHADAKVVVLAPSVGSVAQATDYFSMMEFNVRAIAGALSP
jgi:ABC-type Zn uptake system ZnuABC Zn-binding protein ZnuA